MFKTYSGKITTTDTLPYWYLNEKGNGTYDSAPTKNSEIIFIENGESPYLEIIHYSSQKVKIDHNNNDTKSNIFNSEKTSSKKYNFYLPKDIMQYNLN